MGCALMACPLLGSAQEAKETEYEVEVVRGYEALDKEQVDSAFVYFSRALALMPKAPTNYMLRSNLAEIHLARRDTTLALKEMHEAISLQPDLIALRERRAEILGKLGRYDEALFDYDRIVEINPKRELSLFNRALLKTDMKLYDAAIKDLETIIEANEKAYLPRIALASAELKKGNPEKAERIYHFLISSFPKIPVAYRERARLYIAQDRKALALKDVREVMKYPERVTYEDYLLRGRIWTMYGEGKEARLDFDKARQMGASEEEVRQARKLK
ncbi:Predicted O-linked N-acetylglucosamine transferase, SPINDLY family [Porphyromonas cangingivalis]|uniref:Tetratricopeptide repeat-containing protein n=2 Tax=Porphyromonas cangingivalis TaxID=36874 RepID=A0A1T4L318_PORCN|nr:tetratricopeptide repeat protein [Porphyromonas cangingivalis]SJZ49106.1 Tetratricopeptide repeat-containing protein [Porphyromonas cangingivalis]VEJ03932.1 Predicted O-linked N-acetylglucosamine transferase, SPINDLY family [Porphyromonas cangingivalis]